MDAEAYDKEESRSTWSQTSSVKKDRYNNLEDYYDGHRITKVIIHKRPITFLQEQTQVEAQVCCCSLF